MPQGSKAKFYRELAKTAQSVEFSAFSEAAVPGWLMERARETHGVEIEVSAAQALAGAIGTNLGVLDRELEKLSQFVGDRATIAVADVEAAGTKLPSQDRWRWFELVSERRFEEAVATLGVLLAGPRSVASVDCPVRVHEEGGEGEVVVELKELQVERVSLDHPHADEFLQQLFQF